MRRTLLLLLLVASTLSNLHATKIGIGLADDMGFGIGAQFNGIINAQIGNAGICADYLVLQNKIKAKGIGDSLAWYVGGGLGYRWAHGYKGGKSADIDVRIPVGLDLKFLHDWDVYVQLIPSLRINNSLRFGINGAIGVRYFFITQ